MIRLVLLTAAVLYTAMLVAPAPVEADGAEAPREAAFKMPDLSLAEFAAPVSTVVLPDGATSDGEAVKLAMAAGAELRASRTTSAPMRGLIAAVETAPTTEEVEEIAALWSVSGTRVNLRSGPSTQDDVVSQVTLGTKAAVLNEADGWYQIETADGATTGWIFGKFLQREG